ncbi:MAG: hypothetical protein HYX27_05270 [Acidobacteria bacterium]|nr:hypothetical protein [Acidobacteriota bacterium]
MFRLGGADIEQMPPPKVAKNLARVMGILLILLGLIAMLPNPVVGAEGYFRMNLYLDSLLILFGAVLLAFTSKGESTAATGLYFVAMASLAVAVVGHAYLSDYPSGGEVKLWDLVVCNQEDVYLMGAMAAVLVICGMMNTSSRQVIND